MDKIGNFLIKFFATSFFTGYAPYAPGTFGTLIGVIIYLLFNYTVKSQIVFFIFAIIYFIFGVFISDKAEKIYGYKDCQKIVVDETSCYLFTMFMIPFTTQNIIFSFLIFRIFDVVKPYPIRKLQNIKGGLGIMLDDLLAAVYTNVILHLIKII